MITAIQTAYDGCLFRSRLEARWAVVFNTLGLSWRYEPEGFELPDGDRYLPDFYIEGIGYIEIKPNLIEDDGKFDKFCVANYQDETFSAYRIAGDIPSPLANFYGYPLPYECRMFRGGLKHAAADENYLFCLCPVCGKVGIEFDGRGARVCGQRCCPNDDKLYTPDAAKILVAYIAGRSARFEGPQYNGIDI